MPLAPARDLDALAESQVAIGATRRVDHNDPSRLGSDEIVSPLGAGWGTSSAAGAYPGLAAAPTACSTGPRESLQMRENRRGSRMRWLLPPLLAAALSAASARLLAQTEDLGRIEFPTSGPAEAQKHFIRGVLFLHSFEYDDAAEEFREAQRLEPSFAMAYWGEAMTENHPIWVERDAEAAHKILAKLAPTREARLAKAPTEREKAYLDAVEILFSGGPKEERDRAYAEAMRRLHERSPGDLEAASFYALSLLGTCQKKRDIPTYMRAAAVAEEVFAKNPKHPGAAHYLVHSYDDPVHAPLGLRPARVYAKIAPAAAHALHMPSHIFLASGMWEDVVSSNEASWEAADARVKRKGLSVDERNFHALFWLEYAYLQQGRHRDARRLLAIMEEDAGRSGSRRTRESLAAMRAAYTVEAEQCGGDLAPPRPSEPREVFATGFCAWKRGDEKGLEKAISEFPSAESDSQTQMHAHSGSPVSPPGRATAAGVLRKELEALVLLQKGDREAAVRLARAAAAVEDSIAFEFGPPDVVKPSHELAGEILLAAGRPAEAKAEFEASLARAPGRARSLLGLARAAAKAGDEAAARSAYRALSENLRRADGDLPERSELTEAKP